MATYSVSSGRLVCTGTDITTQGICDAVNANSGSLTPVSGQPASATFFSSDTGYVNAIIRAEISIGNNSAASLWVIESQNVFIQANSFLQNKGDLRIGQKRANGTLSFGGRFVFDSTDNGANTASLERWQLNNGSWIRAYNSIINSDSLLTTPPNFGGIEFDGCYISVLDGIGDGGSYQDLPYSGQTITYKNCTFDAHAGVGLKLYMGYPNSGVTYVLENNSVTNNTYGIQPGGAPLVLVDFKLDTNTSHSVPNIGNANVTFINPDFENLRVVMQNNSDIHRLAYRYNYTALGVDGQPISGIKVRIYDQQNTAVVNNLLTDSNGKVAIPTYNNIPVLLRKTYAGATQTVRQAHSFGSIGYLYNIIAKTIQVTADIVDTNIYINDSSIAETNKATVDAYTALETSAKFYDRAKSRLVDNYTGQSAALVSRSGSLIDAGSYNVTIDATAAQAFAVSGNTITIKASTYTGDMTTTGVITLANGAQFVGTRTDANGTIAPPKTVSITGITAGSRLQIYNVTTATEVYNAVVAGTSYSATYNEGTGYTTGDTVRVRLTYDSAATAKLPFSGQAVVGSTGWSLLASQQDDTVYNTLAVDGSAVTEFSADYPNVQVDISDPDGSTRVDRLYAWFVHTQSSEDGIRNWFAGIVPEDEANFRIVTATLNLKIDNVAATGVTFVDGRRLYRDDGASPLVGSTSGGGSITFFAGKVYTSVVSTASPVITGDIADVAPRVWNATLASYQTAGSTGAALDAASVGGGGGATAQDVWEYSNRTLTASSDPSATTIAAAVWDSTLSAHLTAGSTGEALDARALETTAQSAVSAARLAQQVSA